MKLVVYYAFHSFINQIRKLFRTWFLIYLIVCIGFGAFVGFGISVLKDRESIGTRQEKVGEGNDEYTKDNDDEAYLDSEGEAHNPLNMLKSYTGLETGQLVRLIIVLTIMGILLYEIAGSRESGSVLFLPADVNILFSSPLRPQSVLLYRLSLTMGIYVFFVIYLSFTMRSWFSFMDLGWVQSIMILTSIFAGIVYAKLLKTYVYLASSNNGIIRRNIRYGIFAFIGLSLAGFFFFKERTGDLPATALYRLVESNASSFIPVWGWLKAIIFSAIENKIEAAMIPLTVSAAGAALLLVLIYRQKADFYEDSISKTEEYAERLEKIKNSRSGFALLRKKRKSQSGNIEDRKELSLIGSGANIFFFKDIQLRFRNGISGLFSTGLITYFFSVLCIIFIGKFITRSDVTVLIICAMSVFAFLRAFSNALSKDMNTSLFILVPEKASLKLLFSFLAEILNFTIDIIPAFVIAAVFNSSEVFLLSIGIAIVISVDFFAVIISVFIDSSLPENISSQIRQIIKIMFCYLGLIPDAAILIAGVVTDRFELSLIAIILMNFVVGIIFFFFTTLLTDPVSVNSAKPDISKFTADLRLVKKDFSRIGMSLFLLLAVSAVFQMILGIVLKLLAESGAEWTSKEWVSWVFGFSPLYVIGFPLVFILLKKVKTSPLPRSSLGIKNAVSAFLSNIFMMAAGNIIGVALLLILNLLIKINTESAVTELVTSSSLFWKITVIVILAPIFEELLFRKYLIDRINPYGERFAVLFSAFLFGLFHGNFSQFFYAFGIGIVLGAVYIRTGRIIYTIAYHMLINFLGSIFVPFLMEKSDFSSLMSAKLSDISSLSLGTKIFLIYICLYYILAIAGFVVFVMKCNTVKQRSMSMELPGEVCVKTVWLNAGMILFCLGCGALFVMSVMI